MPQQPEINTHKIYIPYKDHIPTQTHIKQQHHIQSIKHFRYQTELTHSMQHLLQKTTDALNNITRSSSHHIKKIYTSFMIFPYSRPNICNLLKNLVEAWYSLEQYIGLKEDKLSSTTVDFIRSEGNLETKHLYWF